jgi:prolyl oligopeptidase
MKFLFLILNVFFVFEVRAMDQNYQWLEEVESNESLSFAKTRSDRSIERFQKNEKFKQFSEEARTILYAKDRLPAVNWMGGYLYNFWQDQKNIRGVWRRTTIEKFSKENIEWDVLLDLDALAKEEGENWVWKGSNCLEPNYEQCFIYLSRGGKDAFVPREFDLKNRKFVADGFQLPEAKSDLEWIDKDTVFVGTDFGDGSLTNSGYPRIVKIWKRGTPLSSAKKAIEADLDNVSAYGITINDGSNQYQMLGISRSFFRREIFLYRNEGLRPIAIPATADFYGVFQGDFFFQLKEDLIAGEKTYVSGTVIAVPERSVLNREEALNSLQVVFAPTSEKVFSYMGFSKSRLLLSILDNVRGKVLEGKKEASGWAFQEVSLGKNGVNSLSGTDRNRDEYLLRYTDFLQPPSLYFVDAPGAAPELMKKSPSRFDSNNLEVHQHFAFSKDGTKIPYFLVKKMGMKFDGKNPTLLYGYGGFLNPLLPDYNSLNGKSWLEKGGVYVLANIRGGGEFGPRWHQAALRENKQKSYDDFIAVAEDLIAKKITSPAHLGIRGGSNGGLLVGAVFTQRPELFRAVVCEVPLLDMLRYHLLLAGASWMEEYGNPEDPKMAEIIRKYSPFQNLKKDAKYPEVFFYTSTKDDRVHPGHARKMVAKMEDLGHSVIYYENSEGGHGGAANLEQQVKKSAMLYTYLWEKLGN